MNPVKRLGLAVLLVVSVTLLASTPARAKANSGAIQLMNIGDEAQASGEASLTGVKVRKVFDPSWPWWWGVFLDGSGKLTVKCRNLTPGATYWTPAGTFTADVTGAGKISAKVSFGDFAGEWDPPDPYVVDVVRLDPDGSSTTVLTGEFYPW